MSTKDTTEKVADTAKNTADTSAEKKEEEPCEQCGGTGQLSMEYVAAYGSYDEMMAAHGNGGWLTCPCRMYKEVK